MKFTIQRDTLLKTLGRIHRVAEKKNTIPILGNVAIDAADGVLRLKTTDLDIEVSEAISADVEIQGSTTAPVHLLYDIVRKLASSDVTVKKSDDGNQIRVSAGRSGFNLNILPREDFPEFSEGNYSHSFDIAAADLRKIIDKTQFAISTEETRFYLNGIFFHVVEEGNRRKLRSVATDGHRLALADVDAPVEAEGMPAVIVPRKTVGEVLKLLDGAERVSVRLSPTKVRFDVDGVVLVSKVIDGQFPQYDRVIPTGNDKVLTIDRASFVSALDRVSIVSSERGRAVKFAINGDGVNLSVNNADVGNASEDFPAAFDGEPLDVGLNVKYAMDILGNVSGKEAKLLLDEPGSPILIKDESDSDVLFVAMPMRI